MGKQAETAQVTFSEIEEAFFFVNSAEMGMHSAVLHRPTGQGYFSSEMGDMDEISAADLDWDVCIDIPNKNELGLGQDLVFEFVADHLPDDDGRVRQIFRRRGAYGRFKDLLESRGVLQTWYDFENQRGEQALRRWCEENQIVLAG